MSIATVLIAYGVVAVVAGFRVATWVAWDEARHNCVARPAVDEWASGYVCGLIASLFWPLVVLVVIGLRFPRLPAVLKGLMLCTLLRPPRGTKNRQLTARIAELERELGL